MQISSITTNTYKNNPYKINSRQLKTKPSDISVSADGHETLRSIYDKGFYNVAFSGSLIDRYMNDKEELLYQKTLPLHIHNAKEIDPSLVENYFNSLGIPCTIRDGSPKAQKVIAYCCFNAAEIFRQINMPLPTKIDMDEMESNTPGQFPIAGCYYSPAPYKNYPIRTVVFNTLYDWDNHMETSYEVNKQDNFHTSGHFLQTFLHEFGHNVHNHKLYSKFGCPYPNNLGYAYNPNMIVITSALNLPIYDESGNISPNPYVTEQVRNIIKQSSGYGSSLLPETFAEEFAKAILSCMNPTTLRLTRNPFPIQNLSPELRNVLYEVWEGLVADGQGIVK